jgi:hypothetical protein
MNIESYIVSKEELKVRIIESLHTFLSINKDWAENIYTQLLYSHFDQLIDNLHILVEMPYVDKVYRDSYYSYFSSKLGSYNKDCIRLSFFKGLIDGEDFKGEHKIKELKDNYLGFMVLRPNYPNVIGRCIISPKALKNNHFITCSAKFPTTVNNVKFEVEGFPHSSQDSETLSCAETTLWAIMEYFGYKYAEYKPVLPSKIIEILKRVSTERQIPSRGLKVDQISFALREFGFGSRLYSRAEFGDNEFKRLFSCYVESGLPIIVAIDNLQKGGSVAHAILCIGHCEITPDLVDNLDVSLNFRGEVSKEISPKNITFFDNDDINKKFVFIDDNMPVFQQLIYDLPVGGYTSDRWRDCQINHFIVPLYPKIYLEAYEAKNFCRWVLLRYFSIPENSEIYLRFFLTSSRSYKDSLNYNNTFSDDIKQMILEKPMPKFVWVGEISTKELIKNREANGLILIDATEANTSYMKPLIMAAYLNDLISIDSETHLFKEINIPLQNFRIFTNNLK